ncbi:hypothetical protein ACOME3_000437 [Neoechinorhynchus agilis]
MSMEFKISNREEETKKKLSRSDNEKIKFIPVDLSELKKRPQEEFCDIFLLGGTHLYEKLKQAGKIEEVEDVLSPTKRKETIVYDMSEFGSKRNDFRNPKFQ